MSLLHVMARAAWPDCSFDYFMSLMVCGICGKKAGAALDIFFPFHTEGNRCRECLNKDEASKPDVDNTGAGIG